MEIAQSARKHRIADADIVHAWENALVFAEREYDGEARIFIAGPDRSGNLLELIAVPADVPVRIIHADRLRSTFYDKPQGR